MNDSERLDVAVAKLRGVSRVNAKAFIQQGFVTLNGKIVTKPSEKVYEGSAIICDAPAPKYVSRGGLKLAKALDVFSLSLDGKTCLDVGASTGGFTDCMLQHGAGRVYAVDTGTNQLADVLRRDARVVSMEQTNINSLTKADLPEIHFACVDVSFVSIIKIMRAVYSVLYEDGQVVWLVKPQFEAGRGCVGKRGLVKNLAVHIHVLEQLYDFASHLGFAPDGVTRSPITGGDGNIEYLLFADMKTRGLNKIQFMQACKRAVGS